MKNNKKVDYLFSLTTNFKPSSLKYFSNSNIFKNKPSDKNRIICRNFFLFLILLKYDKTDFFKKSTIFIKPFKRKIYTILRAPYRHKLSRHQIMLQRYDIIFKLSFNLIKPITINNFKSALLILKTFSKFNNWIETNIVYNNKIKFKLNFSYKNNFILTNFTVKNKKKVNDYLQ